MTIVRWLALIAALAAWLSLFSYGDRLRGMSQHYMALSAQARIDADRQQGAGRYRPTPQSAHYLELSRHYHDAADRVESIALAVPVALIVLGALAWFRVAGPRRPDP